MFVASAALQYQESPSEKRSLQVTLMDRKPVTLAGLDRELPLAAVDHFADEGVLEETMLESVGELLEESLCCVVEFVRLVRHVSLHHGERHLLSSRLMRLCSCRACFADKAKRMKLRSVIH